MNEVRRHDDLIYDIGMHRGEDTDFYLKKGFRVVAFEANPELVEQCRVRFSEAIGKSRLAIVSGAIVDPDGEEAKRGFVSFYRNNELSIWGTVQKDWAQRNAYLGRESTVIEVPVVDLERTLRSHGVPHYMKIDIEGCDVICLNVLKRFDIRPAYLSFESDKTSLHKIRSEIDLLCTLGYDSFKAIEQSSIARSQTPPREAREGVYADHRFEPGSSGLFGAELPGNWCDAAQLRRKYLPIRLGYYLLGDSGRMNQWKFPGAWLLRGVTRLILLAFMRAPVPGWYDTHARNTDFAARKV